MRRRGWSGLEQNEVRCYHCQKRVKILKSETLAFHYSDSWRVEKCMGVGMSAIEMRKMTPQW